MREARGNWLDDALHIATSGGLASTTVRAVQLLSPYGQLIRRAQMIGFA